jgi:hypothetical protein
MRVFVSPNVALNGGPAPTIAWARRSRPDRCSRKIGVILAHSGLWAARGRLREGQPLPSTAGARQAIEDIFSRKRFTAIGFLD